jgi:FMN phosphatase YigB (HAD superfamily)
LHHFKGPIWGADNAGRFDKDVERFLSAVHNAKAVPENCLMLDDKQAPLLNARQAGLHAIQIRRSPSSAVYDVDAVLPDLRGVIDYALQPEQSPPAPRGHDG